MGKQTLLSQYTMQHRGGVGVKTMQITDKTGKIIRAKLVERGLDSDLIITSKEGQIIRLPFKSIPTLGRATQGVRVMRMKAGDRAASFTVLMMEEEDGSLSNPNEEMDEAELAQLPPIDRLEEAEEMDEEETPKKVATKAKKEPKPAAAKPKAAAKSVSKAASGKSLTVGVYDPKSKKADAAVKKQVAIKAKPTAAKSPAKKSASKPASKKAAPEKPAGKGFVKRKLK